MLRLFICLFYREKNPEQNEVYSGLCQIMILSLDDIDRNPELISSSDYFEDMLICFRPLLPNDDIKLANFLENLSSQTRAFSTRNSYDIMEARELCFAINRYDKLRLIALINNEIIIALFEFSLSIVENDYKRFEEKYNIKLNEKTDTRFGPCISDQYQNRHLGYWLFEKTKTIARQMGKKRLILWGGVFILNKRAIKFYEKIGFKIFTNIFISDNGCECLDGIYNLLE
jgi:GNAT superfamily N-acetyltransferase